MVWIYSSWFDSNKQLQEKEEKISKYFVKIKIKKQGTSKNTFEVLSRNHPTCKKKINETLVTFRQKKK